MIMCDRFYNDPFWVQQLQHELYWGIVTIPFREARVLYCKSEEILEIDTQLGQDSRELNGIDHRVFQSFHDAIATKFRYEHRNDFQMHLPGILGDLSEDDYIKQCWLSFYRQQIERLFDEYINLPRQIIIAGTYPNPDPRGKEAESFLDTICEDIYSSIKKKESIILDKYTKMTKSSENSKNDW